MVGFYKVYSSIWATFVILECIPVGYLGSFLSCEGIRNKIVDGLSDGVCRGLALFLEDVVFKFFNLPIGLVFAFYFELKLLLKFLYFMGQNSNISFINILSVL